MSRQYLVVYHHLPNYRYSVFKALERMPGCEFHFAAGTKSKDGSIPVLDNRHLNNVHSLRNRWLGPFLWQSGLFGIVRANRWDAVILLGDYGHLSSWVAALFMRITRTPVAYWTIGWHRPDKGLRKWYRLTFYRLANRLLLYGNVGRRIGHDLGYPTSRMSVIYNSSGTPDDAQSTIQPTAPQQPWVVGAVARLTTSKRLDLLIEAASMIREGGIDVAVCILGDGPERAALRSHADRLGVPLELPGAVYDEKTLRRFYNRCAVTVLPSAAGLSVTQSLRYGRPVVTHDNPHEQGPEYEAISEGVTGGLYEHDNVTALAESIESWLTNQQQGWEDVAQACHDEIRARWTGEAQAAAIMKQLDFDASAGEADSWRGLPLHDPPVSGQDTGQ